LEETKRIKEILSKQLKEKKEHSEKLEEYFIYLKKRIRKCLEQLNQN